jgi:hypothetical protein
MGQREYEFNYGEPGLFMEIYVAKKAEFQPLLYETLTAGFNLKKVTIPPPIQGKPFVAS